MKEIAETRRALVEAMEELEIVDCHEHLGPERCRVESPVDVFTLFSHYTRGDLMVSGMLPSDYDSLFDQRIPLERRWALFQPNWEQIRFGSYARAALLAAKRFYDFDDITEDTYQPLSQAIQRANTPGIYERVLQEACNIRTALSNHGNPPTTDFGTPLLTPVVRISQEVESWEALSHPVFAPDVTVRSLDDYLDALCEYVLQVKAEGAVGLKMASSPYGPPDRAGAVAAFSSLQNGSETRLPTQNPLRDYVIDQTIAFAAQQQIVVAVHTGYWGDFRQLDPLHMIPLLQRHPRARFDIFHLGYPWVRETLMLGKGFPNVWLNLCWTHIISQRFAANALDEAIDLVPANKILAFGGDYNIPVEKVFGHLVMARENIAQVLARRIVEKRMTESQAVSLARKWFWDNPRDLYRLGI